MRFARNMKQLAGDAVSSELVASLTLSGRFKDSDPVP